MKTKSRWKLQDAKNRLSELIRRVQASGPQAITLRGEEVAVVISAAKYRAFLRPRRHLVDIIEDSPARGADIKVERDRELVRDTKVGDE